MKPHARKDRAWLLATAKAVARELKQRGEGTPLRIRIPSRATVTNTDGWSAVIGTLGKDQPRLEVWFDRFAGYPDRKLYACFHSEQRRQLEAITKRVARKLCPHRVITTDDTKEGGHFALVSRLGRNEFNVPILEKYAEGWTFYGIYDPTRESAARVSPHFCARAAAFFESVARTLPRATPENEEREVYPKAENRKLVAAHLQRERSRLLATERKIHDGYECQVCGLRFEDHYGSIGKDFAEAHHIVPLSRLSGKVTTRLEDLRTVCANCHRMLHRMKGKAGDMSRLRKLVLSRRKRRS